MIISRENLKEIIAERQKVMADQQDETGAGMGSNMVKTTQGMLQITLLIANAYAFKPNQPVY